MGYRQTVGSASPAISGPGDGEIATFTYYIEAGKLVGGSISGSASDYDKYGTLNFASGGFTLTDTLPTFEREASRFCPIPHPSRCLTAAGIPFPL